MKIQQPSWDENSNAPKVFFQRTGNPYLGIERPEFEVDLDDMAWQFAHIYVNLDSAGKAFGWVDHCVNRG